MEKPGIEPATLCLQGIALIHNTTGALFKGDNSNNNNAQQSILHVTHHLHLIYNPTKYQNISKGIKVMEWTMFPLNIQSGKGDKFKRMQKRATILYETHRLDPVLYVY